MSGDSGIWAYAIAEQARLSGPDGEVDLSWLFGVGESRVRAVGCSGLAVLVSDVSRAEFGQLDDFGEFDEAALRQNPANLDWLDEVARLHHYVVDAAARLFPLLPVGLGAVYGDDAALCAALADHRDQLLGTLHRVGGRVEWGVQAYAAPDGSAPVNGVRAVHAELAGQAAQAVVRPPQPAQLSRARRPMLLNAAYLLDTGDAPEFTAAVAAEAIAHPELRIELTGPWPPYSFAAEDDGGN